MMIIYFVKIIRLSKGKVLGGTITAKGGIRPEFQFGPKLLGSGIGGGDIDNKALYGNVEYASYVKVEVSSDGKKWQNYDGTKPKQYMMDYERPGFLSKGTWFF